MHAYQTTFFLGSVAVRNRCFLAPMSGVTDLPFRKLAHELGAGLVVSEMIASKALVSQDSDARNRILGADLRPFVVQLVGHEPAVMAQAARIAVDNGADVIDINMGCPAREITGKMAGSALMKEPDLALRIIDAVIAAVACPVTLKMRLGWDTSDMNAPELAQRAEQAGIVLLTVHARTRCQFFKGKADWSAVASVTRLVNIPVIINGDIKTIKDANAATEKAGASGVMIGRGAYGAPWQPGRIATSLSQGIDPGAPPLLTQRDIALCHIKAMLSHYGHEMGLRKARKHLGWYLEQLGLNMTDAKAWRQRLCTNDNPEHVFSDFADVYDYAGEVAA